MCCSAKINMTREFLQKNKGKKEVTVYKIVLRGNTYNYDGGYKVISTLSLYGPFKSEFRYKPGVIQSDATSENSPRIRRDKPLNMGIHCFTSRNSARNFLKQEGASARIIKATANLRDLVGIGYFGNLKNNAVFRKITLSQSEYDKAINS